MNRTTIAFIAVLCMAMVALAVAAIPTGTSSPSGNATSTEHQFHPFTGTPSAIPGQIEAENYDTGGQGVAWFDTTPENRGGAYREDDVDIETGGSGHVVAFVKSSEWLTYTVDVQEAGTYMATFRASSPWADREVWVWVDGILKAQVRVPDTTSFDTYGNATANVTLPAGSHYIRLEFVGDAQNLDYMTFEMATGTGGTESTPTPTITSTVTPTPTGNQTGGAPTIMITSPQNGTVVTPGNVTVTAMVSNFSIVDKQGQANVAGEGHVHFYMDVSPIPDTPGQPAIPTDPTAVWNHVSGTTYVFTNVTPGQHMFTVQIVNNDHTPVVPSVSDSVTVTATGTPTVTGNVTPTPTSDGGGGNVTPTPTGNVTPTPTTTSVAGSPPEAIQYAADWPMPNRDYNNSRASTDSPITAANVNTLGLTWAYNLTGVGTTGAGASNPIILGDTIYFQDLKANVIALNRTTGVVKWVKNYNATFVEGPNGPTAGYGKLFVAKDAYSMAALNATTGDELWAQRLSFVNTTGIDIAPATFDNMVYTSTVPGTGDLFYAPGGIGYIYGLDQETGAIRWNVSTVDTPDLWGHPEVNSGGGCWYTPAIDTMTGMMYWAISNPAPFPGTAEWPSGSSRPGPNLYTNSMMALNHTTGAMNWFTQVLPHDIFDHDLQIAPILTSANINGTQQEIVLGAGKMGTVYAFNRSTGALLWQTDVGDHNGNDKLDVLPNGTTTVIPSALGGVETPMAYADGVVYVPVVNSAMNWTPTSLDFSSFNLTAGTGELVAIDVNTGEKLWDNRLDAVNVGSAMVVNDLVFTATFDGTIYAFNRTDGAQLWTYKAPSAINGWPAVAGNTIVWPAGGGGSFGNNATPLLLAFGLPGGGNVTPIPTPGTPTIMITSPLDGTFVTPGNVTVTAMVGGNFSVVDKQGQASVPGEGHVHFYMDAGALPSDPTKPAIPTDPNASWAHVSGTTYTFTNVTAGTHTFSVQLVNNDHTPITPIVSDSATVTASGIPVTTTAATTAATTTMPTTAAATTATTTTTTATTTAGGTTSVDLTAQNIKFDKSTITVPAGAQITVTFNNMDSGIPHNFAVYTDASASTTIFRGSVITGPATTTYTFTAPSTPGTYFFRCDVHPTVMTGQFIVQ